MIKSVLWSEDAIGEMEWYRKHDRRKAQRVAKLIKSVLEDHPLGIGKPEPLRGNLSGYWSRRVDQSNRLVYKIENGQLHILQVKGHYGSGR